MKRLRQLILDAAGYVVIMTPLFLMAMLVVWLSQIGQR
jgi:hypothetical protein